MKHPFTPQKFKILQQEKREDVIYCFCKFRILQGCFYGIYVQRNQICALEVVGDRISDGLQAWNQVVESALSPIHLHDWINDLKHEAAFTEIDL